MTAEGIPALDPIPLPGPLWLFHGLWVTTFLLHMLFVNLALGGSLLAAWHGLTRSESTIPRFFAERNTWGIAFAITFGIAPLLFIQAVYGRLFYSGTILLGWAWLAMVGLLLVAYYATYLAKARTRAGGPGPWAAIAAVALSLIAAIHVAAHLIHVQPRHWAVYAQNPWRVLADPSFLPRYLHFVLAALAFAGALLARSQCRRGSRGDGSAAAAGVRVALWATAANLAVGLWLLVSLPADVLGAFMRGGSWRMIPLLLGVLAGVGLLVVAARIRDPLAESRAVRRVLELVVGAMLVMVLTRHQVRALYLEQAGIETRMPVVPQWGAIGLFLVVLVAGVALTAWVLLRTAREHASGAGEVG